MINLNYVQDFGDGYHEAVTQAVPFERREKEHRFMERLVRSGKVACFHWTDSDGTLLSPDYGWLPAGDNEHRWQEAAARWAATRHVA